GPARSRSWPATGPLQLPGRRDELPDWPQTWYFLLPGRISDCTTPCGSRSRQRRHYLVRDRPHQSLHVRRRRDVPIAARPAVARDLALARRFRFRLGVAAAEGVVAAQVAVLAAVEADVVVAELLLQLQQLARLAGREVVHVPQLPREDEDLAVGVD